MFNKHTVMSFLALLIALGSILYTSTVISASKAATPNCTYPVGTLPSAIDSRCNWSDVKIGTSSTGLVLGSPVGTSTGFQDRIFDVNTRGVKSDITGSVIHLGKDASAIVNANFKFNSSKNILSVLGNISSDSALATSITSDNTTIVAGSASFLLGGISDVNPTGWKISTGGSSDGLGNLSIQKLQDGSSTFVFSKNGNLLLDSLSANLVTSPKFCFGPGDCFSKLPTADSSAPTGDINVSTVTVERLCFKNSGDCISSVPTSSSGGSGSDYITKINSYFRSIDGIKEYIASLEKDGNYPSNVDTIKSYIKGLPDTTTYKDFVGSIDNFENNYNTVRDALWSIYP